VSMRSGSGAEPRSLSVQGLVKHFGDVRANEGLDIDFLGGEIHGVLGENGAGKSTLIKILSGVYTPDAGTIAIDQEEVALTSPMEARRVGIAVVHQQSALVPRLSILENVALIEGTLGRIDRRLGEVLVTTAEELGFRLNPHARPEELSVAGRQRAEIARALMWNAAFVMLDEPTAVLAPSERDQLFELLRKLASNGVGVILVTHHLDEALHHCDTITVLRQGKVVAHRLSPASLSEADLIKHMVGEPVVAGLRARPSTDVREAVRAVELSGAPAGGRPLRGVSFSVRTGEVLGIAGVEGNGQRELSAALTGAWAPPEGDVLLHSIPLRKYTSRERNRRIGDIPDDETLAISYEFAAWENLMLSKMSWQMPPTPPNRRRLRDESEKLVELFEIKTRSLETLVGQLSGGNRRRIQIARELSKDPEVLVAAYATRGLDVRSTEQVKAWIRKMAAGGTAVVYISSDLEELLEVSDRIAILVRGRITGVLDASNATVEALGRLMLSEREYDAA
jgi:ABC-type uncharacterized transport system ATPase subunit